MVSKITNPPSQVDLVDKVNEIIDDKQDKLDVAQLSYYGKCTTASSSQNKVVSCSGFVLKTGVSIRVRFTSGQGYNGTPTLNVNSTGAINIMSIGTTSALRYSWQAGEIVSFTYDGTNWLMEDAGTATTTYYGYTKLTSSATSPSTSTALTPGSLNQLVLTMIEPYPVYSTSETYSVGDRVRRSYNAWECIVDIPEEEDWDDTHWTMLNPIQTQLDAKQATLVSGTNIKTINNQSLLGSGNISISGDVDVDEETITTNADDELQTIAVVNANTETGAVSPLPIWNGTETQWNQGEATTWYNWMSGGTSQQTSNLPSSDYWRHTLTDGSKIMVFSDSSNKYLYSTDGTNWSSGTLNIGSTNKAAYGNGVYIAISGTTTEYDYSTNGTSWTKKTAPVFVATSFIYGDKFIWLKADTLYYSTDGISWQTVSLPISDAYDVTYYNGKYVILGSSGAVIYSGDGISWTSASNPPSSVTGGYQSITCDNGRYVAICYNGNTVAYSDDADSWTTTTNLPYSIKWTKVVSGGGYFLATPNEGGVAAYSSDGINWTGLTLAVYAYKYYPQFMNDYFYIFRYNSSEYIKVSFASFYLFTTDANPTTSSQLYSAVGTPSALTITSVGTGTITASDSKTYSYNPNGNEFSYRSIGEIHPDWLCNINGVGVKIGTEFVANNSDGGSSRNIGEIIQSTIPLTDAGLHLLDGALISGAGSYSAFVTYISGLVTDYPDLFETEANWQQAVTDYGVCGKFVYDSVNDTVRLPKITGFTEGTIDPTVLGDLVEAGLPDHMHTVSITHGTSDGTFAHVDSATNNTGTKIYDSSYASTYNPIYGNSTTVQPQAIKVLYYTVIANSTKTNIEVDIDEVMTDLNGKADVDLSNVNASGTRLSGSWSMPSNRYTDLTLGASGAEYVAPANGYFSWAMSASAAGQSFSLDYRGERNTTWLLSSGRKSYANDDFIRMWLPVKKGEKVVTTYNGGTNSRFRFTYAEGDQ